MASHSGRTVAWRMKVAIVAFIAANLLVLSIAGLRDFWGYNIPWFRLTVWTLLLTLMGSMLLFFALGLGGSGSGRNVSGQ